MRLRDARYNSAVEIEAAAFDALQHVLHEEIARGQIERKSLPILNEVDAKVVFGAGDLLPPALEGLEFFIGERWLKRYQLFPRGELKQGLEVRANTRLHSDEQDLRL